MLSDTALTAVADALERWRVLDHAGREAEFEKLRQAVALLRTADDYSAAAQAIRPLILGVQQLRPIPDSFDEAMQAVAKEMDAWYSQHCAASKPT
jgi:hypothetical protein